jgi:hypothetical protein
LTLLVKLLSHLEQVDEVLVELTPSISQYLARCHLYDASILYVMARTSPSIGNLTYTFTASFASMYKEEQINLGEGRWSWLGCCSLWFRCLIRSSLEL